jgi:hypothetical protein
MQQKTAKQYERGMKSVGMFNPSIRKKKEKRNRKATNQSWNLKW